MKGDFTRDTFDPTHHFSRVLMQQGRVTLDADHNEQTAILLHYLRTLARDLIGPFGVPAGGGGGFTLTAAATGNDVVIGRGRCYVDGILVENDEEAGSYLSQHHPPADPEGFADFLRKGAVGQHPFLLYLDVWERHVSWIEAAAIRESALGGPDTCTRTEVVWQLKARLASVKAVPAAAEQLHELCTKENGKLRQAESERRRGAQLTARLRPLAKAESACITAPDSRYRGLENHLYRVEIHDSAKDGVFSFKWSRDNGSIATRILGFAGSSIEVASSRGFEAGNWVEVSFDEQELQGKPGWLMKLVKVEGERLVADPETVPEGLPNTWKDAYARRNPKARRWDQTSQEDQPLVGGAIEIQAGMLDADDWFELEDGIEVAFTPAGNYRCGDYWLIPARVASGDIEWPQAMEETGQMVAQPQLAHGIVHHLAPLGFVHRDASGSLQVDQCLCPFEPLSACAAIVASGPAKAPQPKKAAKP